MRLLEQILGILASAIAIAAVQFSKKHQILFACMFANLLSMITFLLLNGLSSAVAVNLVAVFQCGINSYLSYKGKEASIIQKSIFTILFLLAGVFQYSRVLDVLPIIGSLLFMCAAFQKEEQKMRVWSGLNAGVWIVYDCIVGTTAVIGQIFSFISVLIGLYRYRNSDKIKASGEHERP